MYYYYAIIAYIYSMQYPVITSTYLMYDNYLCQNLVLFYSFEITLNACVPISLVDHSIHNIIRSCWTLEEMKVTHKMCLLQCSTQYQQHRKVLQYICMCITVHAHCMFSIRPASNNSTKRNKLARYM